MSIQCATQYIAHQFSITRSATKKRKLKEKRKNLFFLFLQMKKEREFIFRKSNFINCFKNLKPNQYFINLAKLLREEFCNTNLSVRTVEQPNNSKIKT